MVPDYPHSRYLSPRSDSHIPRRTSPRESGGFGIPHRIVVLPSSGIITDGEENAGTEFNLSHIESMIKKQIEKDQWNVVYISADPKAFEDAGKIGIAESNVVRFEANWRGDPGLLQADECSMVQHKGRTSSCAEKKEIIRVISVYKIQNSTNFFVH
jgi:hypothetical protein